MVSTSAINPSKKYCTLLNNTGNIACHITGMMFPSLHNISCRSSNVIFCITCKICGKQYLGQTLMRIKDRIYEHLRDIDHANKEKSSMSTFLFHKTWEERYRSTYLRIHKGSPKKSAVFDNQKQCIKKTYTSTSNTCTPGPEYIRLDPGQDMT